LRNESESRLSQKPSKRKLAESRASLIQSDEDHTLNSDDGFFYEDNYLKIDNTHVLAEDVAQAIVDEFGFNVD